jgi:hypothetical protein
MTHGEAWFLKYKDVEMIAGELVPISRALIPSLPHRMSRFDAGIYYTNKIRKHFKLEEKLGFYEIEHVFDYYEALRIKERIL